MFLLVTAAVIVVSDTQLRLDLSRPDTTSFADARFGMKDLSAGHVASCGPSESTLHTMRLARGRAFTPRCRWHVASCRLLPFVQAEHVLSVALTCHPERKPIPRGLPVCRSSEFCLWCALFLGSRVLQARDHEFARREFRAILSGMLEAPGWLDSRLGESP